MDAEHHDATRIGLYEPVDVTGRVSTTYLRAGDTVRVAYTPMVEALRTNGYVTIRAVRKDHDSG